MGAITNEAKSPLLPDRFKQARLFVCDTFDAASNLYWTFTELDMFWGENREV